MTKNTYTPALIQFELKNLGIKQTELAEILGVSVGAISRAIAGDKGLESLREKIIKLIEGRKQNGF
jgi:predicted transcriptional regulator